MMNNGTYGIIDGLVLRNYTPQTWQFDGGYITLDANGAATSWNYYVTDHLGSTRKVVTNTNTVKETANYYPYGSEMAMTSPSLTTNPSWQPFRFSGKELDKLNGLNMYDFGARWFDVAGVPVWTSVDPMCEKYYDITPYSYCHNDPINRIDKDGNDDFFTKTGRFLFSKGQGGHIYIYSNGKYKDFKTFNLRGKANMQMAANIIGYYAKDVGIKYNMNGGKGEVGIHTMHSYDGQRALAATANGNIYLNVTNGYLDEYMYDAYQLRSTLVHESEHKKDQDEGKDNASAQRHAEIVLYEMQSKYFPKCSDEYKEEQKRQRQRYEDEAEREANRDWLTRFFIWLITQKGN